MTDHEFKAPERTARAVSKDGCGYNLYEPDGSDYPCDRPAVGYRWYQDVGEHEDLLDVACEIHRNAGGDRMAELMAEVERLTGERDRARGLAARLEEQVARVEALAVVVANRMMATAKPSEIWAALRGEGACEGSPMCPGDTHTEGCYSLAWTDAERQQCTDARCLTPCTECARAALAEAHVAEFERLRAVVTRGALLSEDRRYRYLLVRRWDSSLPDATFIMLNPSTADEHDDDPTIRKCIGFAKRWGCGGIKVVNLYAYRATQPRDCFAADDPIGGAEADTAIIHAAESAAVLGWPLVAAWGANEKGARAAEVLAWAAMRHAQCLGFTRSGQPRHPLMLSYATPLEPLLPESGGE